MAIRDKIRDELYGDSEGSTEHDLAASAFSEVTDSIRDPHSAIKVLAITVTAEVAAIAMLLVARDKVVEFLSDGEFFVYAALVPFAIGFLTAFTVYRLMELRRGDSRPSVASGIMSGFSGHDHRSSKMWIWFISTASGVLNTLLFFALISFQVN